MEGMLMGMRMRGLLKGTLLSMIGFLRIAVIWYRVVNMRMQGLGGQWRSKRWCWWEGIIVLVTASVCIVGCGRQAVVLD